MAEDQSKPTLPTFSWIGHLKEDDRELLSSYGEFFPAHPGNVIIEEGMMQTQVFVVVSGELEVYGRDENGEPFLHARVGPGETLGEVSLFDPGPAFATVTASEFSQLWRIADSDLIQFMEENPGAGNLLLRTLTSMLAQRLRQVDPAAFGLSSYAVVDSPELPPKEEIQTEATPLDEDPIVVPLPVPSAPMAPVTAGDSLAQTTPLPERSSRSSQAPLTPVTSAPAGSGASAKQPAAALIQRTAPAAGKMPGQTQSFPDPDELEPL